MTGRKDLWEINEGTQTVVDKGGLRSSRAAPNTLNLHYTRQGLLLTEGSANGTNSQGNA